LLVGDWKVGDFVRVKDTGESGRVIEVLPGGRYLVQELASAFDKPELEQELPISRGLGDFSADELELYQD
jgi:hypothetical protein